MNKPKRPKIIRWLLYVTLVTTVITSVTLARYSSNKTGTAKAVVASFISDTTQDLQVPLDNLLYPGSVQSATFKVTNFDSQSGKNNEVQLGYGIRVETTGNLPLTFSLTGQKETGDTDVTNSRLVDYSNFSSTLKAEGGLLPPASGTDSRKEHTYTLTVTWPSNATDEGYSDEIDSVVVKITTEQISANES